MRYLLLTLILTGCAKSIPGNWNLVQCGHISGCDVEYTFHTKAECEGMAKQLSGGVFAYQCMQVK